MKKDQSFHDYLMGDIFAGIRGIASRAMFGGWGIYKEGVIFAIVVDGELYFKTDASNRAEFERRGSRPFVYNRGKHRSTTMSYWLLPQEILEDRQALEEWVERSAGINQKLNRRRRAKL